MWNKNSSTFHYIPAQPWLSVLRISIYESHISSFHLYSSESTQILKSVIFWSSVQSKTQIIKGLTDRPNPTDPAPSFPELPLRISTVYSPSAFQRGGRGGVCAIQRRVVQKEERKKYHPLAQISVGLPLLGVSATCCAQLAKHTAMRNSLGRSRLVYK